MAESHTQLVLTLNGGSSSLKFALYPVGTSTSLLRGQFDRLGQSGTTFSVRREGQHQDVRPVRAEDHATALAHLFDWLEIGGCHARRHWPSHRPWRAPISHPWCCR